MKKRVRFNPFTPFLVLIVLLFIGGFVLGSVFLNPSSGNVARPSLFSGFFSPPVESTDPEVNRLVAYENYGLWFVNAPTNVDGTNKFLEDYFPYAEDPTHLLSKEEGAQAIHDAKLSGKAQIIVCAMVKSTGEPACLKLKDSVYDDYIAAVSSGEFE